MSVEHVRTNQLAASGTYSDVVVVTGPGRWIHVAGQLGIGPNDQPPSYADEVRAAYASAERLLTQHGAGLEHVVRQTVFVTTFDEYAEVTALRRALFKDQLPTSTAVQVAGLLFGARIEIELVAFVPQEPAPA